jgi:GNAT superfamily N-acetyltransferase
MNSANIPVNAVFPLALLIKSGEMTTIVAAVVILFISLLHPTLPFYFSHLPFRQTYNPINLNTKLMASLHEEQKTIALVGVTCDSGKDPSPILREGITDLFKLYFEELFELGCDLGFQGFQNEWIDLPGKYDFEKRGGIFVAVELPIATKVGPTEYKRDSDGILRVQPGMDSINESTKTALRQVLKDKGQVIGCIAIRSLTETCGEVKRMYIRKTHRRLGIGKLLAKQIIDHGWEECKYEEIKLDSLERLGGAITLYENLGFSRIDPYCECPEDDHVCMSMFREK